MQDTVEANRKGTEWQMSLMKNSATRIANQTDMLKEQNEQVLKLAKTYRDLIPNLVPLEEEKKDDESEVSEEE
jgi:hypothetical protein